MTPREHAHWLAANFGWWVFPVGADKKPLPGFRWKELASDRHEAIDQMPWDQAAMPAVYCGKSGIAVLDIDTTEGRQKLATFFNGALPSTQQQDTPRGGTHLIFKAPTFEQSIGTGIPCQGVDIRAGAGYICWYGKGDGLEWDQLPWPFPAPIKQSQMPLNGSRVATEPAGGISLAVQEGNRNHDLARTCGAILRGTPGIKAADYFNQVLDYCRVTHNPPLPLEEIKATAASIWNRQQKVQEVQQVVQVAQVQRASGATMDVADLLLMDFAPIRYVCAPFIAEGYTVYAGKPKIGKTTLMRQLMVAAHLGGDFLGYQCTRSEALFICLEESQRLFRAKLMAMGYGQECRGMQVAFQWPRGDIGIAALDEYMQQHPGTRLIVIDSYEAVKEKTGSTKESPFSIDYQIGQKFQEFCKRHPGVALIVICHTRKAEAADAIDLVAGTGGVTAAADTICVIHKNPLGYILHCQGRNWDQDFNDYEILRDGGRWRMLGPASEEVVTMPSNAWGQAAVLKTMQEVGIPVTGKSLAMSLGKHETTISEACRKLEQRGVIKRQGGKWVLA